MSDQNVFMFAGRMVESATCLKDGGHQVQAIMMIYVAIDQMAWLSTPNERSSGHDFKAWVETYMLSKNALPCTAAELWEARNGLLHTGTSESTANTAKPEIRKLHYTFGRAINTKNENADVGFLNVEELMQSFTAGATWFNSELEQDQDKLKVAKSKLGRTLAVTVLDIT